MRSILLSLLLLCSAVLLADDSKYKESYNLVRGIEAYQKDNNEEALDYFSKEVQAHPDNGYAHMWMSKIYLEEEEVGKALTAVNTALKYIPSKDKEYKAVTYALRGSAYLALEDTVQCLKDFEQAVKLNPAESAYYKNRAQVYYEQGRLDLSDRDYQKMIDLDKGDVMGYMGLGRNANERKDYVAAIKQFDLVTKLASDYSSAYSFRAESYIAQKKYAQALDDIITAMSIDEDDKAFSLMQEAADTVYDQMVAKLKLQQAKEPKNQYWPFCIGVVNESQDKYAKAIPCYKQSLALESRDYVAYRIAICYNALGDYNRAVDFCEQAILGDSTQTAYALSRIDYLDNAGRTNEALKSLDTYIAQHPDDANAYYRRGRINRYRGKIDAAIEDFTMLTTILPETDLGYYLRGEAYHAKGDMAKAKADFERTVQSDTVPGEHGYAAFAYFYLGNRDKTIALIDTLLHDDSREAYYNVACLYSLLGEKDKAIDCLRRSFEHGGCNFVQIRRDTDLDNIRTMPEFVKLVDEEEAKHKQMIAADADDGAYEEKTEEIPFVREGGVCKVKCTINGLPLHFIFDTGASDVLVSSVEATFMLKNGYLSTSDITGKRNYMTADGNIVEGTTLSLRDVRLGTLHLNDVRASVVKNQSAPLLLGQSVLARLGRIEIDNAKKVIRITYRNKVTEK